MNQGKRGPDKKPRKRRQSVVVVRVQLSLTPANAEYIRMRPSTNSAFVNHLIEVHRDYYTP